MKKFFSSLCVVLLTIVLGIGLYILYNNYNQKTLFIQTLTKKISLSYEVADTPEKQSIGLMYRQEMPNNHSMIFIFPEPQMIYMWMKNTYIPLDMIFFDETGKITHIHQNAKGVIEVNAGFVNTHHISVGHQIIYSGLNH